MTAKPVVAYSTPITRNGPELSGSVRGRWNSNTLVAQKKTDNNRNRPDLWSANPLVRVRALPAPRHSVFSAPLDRRLFDVCDGAVERVGYLRGHAPAAHEAVPRHRDMRVAEVVSSDSGRQSLVVNQRGHCLAEAMGWSLPAR